MKSIVTDTYDFPTLIEGGYVYVDKTALLRRMVSGIDGRFFFMSRPRRFGKSLMISTLEQIDEKGYAKAFSTDRRRVVKVGVNYDPRERVIACEVVSGGVNGLLKAISDYPGKRVPELVGLTGISRRTIERYLKGRLVNLVEFRGAPKTGGYYSKGV